MRTLSAMTTGFVIALVIASTLYAASYLGLAVTKAVHSVTTVIENSDLYH